MDFTRSHETVVSPSVAARYELLEVRNAAAILRATNPVRFAELEEVLDGFSVLTTDLLTKGGQETALAARLNGAFRAHGWREGQVGVRIALVLRKMPYRPAGETTVVVDESEVANEGYKVDNVADRIALDVEWNAKDGNLDRDLAAYRALYDAGLIDAAVLVTRTLEIREFARNLGMTVGALAGMTAAEAKRILSTTTTTNLAKLRDRLARGDSGGCPVLVVAICDRTFDGHAIESVDAALPLIAADLERERAKRSREAPEPGGEPPAPAASGAEVGDWLDLDADTPWG